MLLLTSEVTSTVVALLASYENTALARSVVRSYPWTQPPEELETIQPEIACRVATPTESEMGTAGVHTRNDTVALSPAALTVTYA